MAAAAALAGVGMVASVAGGVLGYMGAQESGKAAWAAAQRGYHEEKQKAHYNAKAYQRQMIDQLHMSMAQWGASGAAVGEGSPVIQMMNLVNNLEEERSLILRGGDVASTELMITGADQWKAAQYQATGSLLKGIGGAASLGMAA